MTKRDDHPESATARKIIRDLPDELRDIHIGCPLCSSPARARGLRLKTRPGTDESFWYVLFTCASCGLISEFNTKTLDADQLKVLEGSPWAGILRRYREASQQDQEILHKRTAAPRQMIGISVFSMVTWILLTGNFDLANLLWGLAVSLLVARLSYRLVALEIKARSLYPDRWLHFLALLFEFIRQLIVQNITLSIRVLRPDLPVRPGIIAVPTRLEGDFELTLLASLLSLTPDTVTVDVDQEKKVIYLHWIDVKTTDSQEAKKIIVTSMEDRIIGWLHGKEGIND